ncbi:MAG: TraB/GumN family protein [Verrucomicrobia bacterium]|nr:TraB/GumN family protein [Verrucomicrobiota bacterium]
MLLQPERMGFRLQMHGDEYSRGTSIKVYTGLTAKVMTLFGYAKKQDFIDAEGHLRSYAINKKSLGNYMYRLHKCANSTSRLEKMEQKYAKSHDKENVSYTSYRHFANLIAKEVDTCFSKKALHLNEFVTSVETFQPKALQNSPMNVFYKIKNKENETVGYLVGTEHNVTEKKSNLHPKIKQAVLKSTSIAFEIQATIWNIIKSLYDFIKNIKNDPQYIIDYADLLERAPKCPGTESQIQSVNKQGKKASILSLETYSNHEKVMRPLVKLCKRLPKPLKIEQEDFVQEKDLELQIDRMRNLDPEVTKMGVDDRNIAMHEASKPLLKKASKENRLMIAVGAAHLVGETGFIKSLQGQNHRLIKVTKS